ncbi:hypothetical protein AR457_21735 [Streptomyces agglomeratus]|uniref:RDD family protein n=1 Tax=Streptomyces agglomeratus TaxID=285458 RepID=A0A1E5PAX5_9ACTN|nr:RDD family protein [Streptomyces agglomeratus]OEJ26682.1 hypothetical protein AS594_21495 [Streptomyces agglomeratus]OEJ46367.1 hypothetical protein AR457_21735 [Streptomyces agglomeratus]
MSAPTPASGDSSPTPGYYPDPSIPGYVRFWNGASWVPGTSRPAPSDDEGTPAGPTGAASPAPAPTPSVEETGPLFFDEEPEGAHLHGNTPEPASAWQADTSRQTGFGGDRDRRVSWGSTAPDSGGAPAPAGSGGAPSGSGGRPAAAAEESGPGRTSTPGGGSPAQGTGDPRRAQAAPGQSSGEQRRAGGGVDLRRTGGSAPEAAPGPAPAAPGERDPRGAAADPSGGALPGVRTPGRTSPPDNGTVTMRALRRGDGESPHTARADGTMAIRTMTPGAGRPQVPGQSRPQPPAQGETPGQGSGAAQAPAQGPVQVPGQAPAAGQFHAGAHAQATGPAQTPGRAQAHGQGAAAAQAPAHGRIPGAAQTTPDGGAAGAAPVSAGAGGGAASWAQQVHRLAQPDQDEAGGTPVVPWKPPVSDPFLQAAQAQAAARPAGLAKRLAARLIDTLVLGAVLSAVAVPLGTAALAHIDDKIEAAKLSGETVTVWLLDGTTAGYLGIVIGAYLLVGVVYEVLPTAKWGRTLGKKLCRMHVRDIEAHEPPTFGAALRRWLVYGVLGVLGIGIVNAAWCLFDRPWRQCWHDKAARTFVAGD